MKEFFGHRLLDGKYHWAQVGATRGRSRQEGVRLNFRVDSSRRDAALSLVANDLAEHGEDWALPLGSADGPWRIDLSKLALRVRALADQTWLEGERMIIPAFDIVNSPYLEDEYANGKTAVVRFTIPVHSPVAPTTIPSSQDLSSFLGRFRSDHSGATKRGFLMMPFGDTPAHERIAKCIRDVCSSVGLEALRADDSRYSDDLLPNIRTYMHGCDFGVAVFERLTSDLFNPNVSLEVGYMLALGKPVCLLKDRTLQALQSDLVGRLYDSFDVQQVEETLPPVLVRWLREKRLTSYGPSSSSGGADGNRKKRGSRRSSS